MESSSRQTLEKFQCEYNRQLEEDFARTLAENDKVRLFFINENRAFTNGRMVVVDPAESELFCDVTALRATEKYLNWPSGSLEDEWSALRMVTRAQTIHECLHLLYTEFPGRQLSDPRCDTSNKKRVCGLLSNIIEDAYIEAVGCSYYDNMEMYLQFGRVARLFARHPGADSVTQFFGDKSKTRKNKSLQKAREKAGAEPQIQTAPAAGETLTAVRGDKERLQAYISYMINYLLYPMVNQAPPAADIAEFVEPSKELMRQGSLAANPGERYAYAAKCFELIAHLIPTDDDPLGGDMSQGLLGGKETHEFKESIGGQKHSGRVQAVSRGLFRDGEGRLGAKAASRQALRAALEQFAREKEQVCEADKARTGRLEIQRGRDYDCAVVHNKIKINEKRPAVRPELRERYQSIYKRYKSHILSYCTRFAQLLQARATVREQKHLYGAGITSARLGDVKKRYWYRDLPGEDVPDLAVLLLIDGSGSMQQDGRWRAARASALILHEVLQRQDIPHAVVEHRAHFDKPEIDTNILVDFDGRAEEKYNLMQLSCHGENRDGLALFWAERYLQRHTNNEYRLIIVLSDGLPAHHHDSYYPPVSTQDTANAVRKISKRGTHIVAVSLDEAGKYECYENLTPIYPNLVACNDLTRLTGKLLGIIAKIL